MLYLIPRVALNQKLPPKTLIIILSGLINNMDKYAINENIISNSIKVLLIEK